MTMDLVCGNIGVAANQKRAIELAGRFGFESVGAKAEELGSSSLHELEEIAHELRSNGLVFGASGLPVDFRSGEERYRGSLAKLAPIAKNLQIAGVSRVGTWISPSHSELDYRANFQQHRRRLSEIATILSDHGLRLGLEYVGTPRSRSRAKFSFVHNLSQVRELIMAIDSANVGLVLDSWHWWAAEDTKDDLLELQGSQIVAVDINDAPAGVPVTEVYDNRRELPLATGVIDLAGFLGAVKKVGYTGPVRAEPFNESLNALSDDDACQLTARAVRSAFSLIGQA